MNFICACGKPFNSSRNGKYCSRSCYKANRTKNPILIRDSNLYRKCSICLEIKLIEFFEKNKNSYRTQCKTCRKLKIKEYRTSVNDNRFTESNHKRRFKRAAQIARERQKAWELTYSEYHALICLPCFYCKNSLQKEKGYGVGLDRIDNNFGYKTANVVPCCNRCNYLRGDHYSHNEFILFSDLIMEIDLQRNKSNILDEFKKHDILKKGNFTLASGNKSDFYYDIKSALLKSQTLKPIVDFALLEFNKLDYTATNIASSGIGGNCLLGALLNSLCIKTREINGCIVREEVKSYGMQKQIEGDIRKKSNVIVIEDVTTTGGSAMKVVSTLREKGYTISGVLTVFDRQEGAKDLFDKNNVKFISLLTKSDFHNKD
jgi:orotate phosphoribosyltransferase